MEANFEYFNLMDVDPTFKPVEEGVYTLQPVKFTPKMVPCKSGKSEGQTVPVVNAQFQIVNHDTFSGRRVFESFWLNNGFGTKSLRRYIDAIGVAQEPGQPLMAFLEQLATLNPAPTIKAFVGIKEDGKNSAGETAPENYIKWTTVQPA